MIHVIQDGDDYEVWLDTEVAERDGICLGIGKSKTVALRRAALKLLGAYGSVLAHRRKEKKGK